MVGAGINVFAVWGYIITKAKRGFIEINPKLLAFTLGGTEEEVRKALDFLQQPDENSRSKLEEGRRLVKEGQFQYRIVNWQHYDEIRNEIERRDYNRVRKQQYRKLGQRPAAQSQPPSTPVNSGQQSEPPLSDNPPVAPPAGPDPKRAEKLALEAAALAIYDAYPRKVGKGPAVKSIIKALAKIEPSELLKRTLAYAAARANEDPQFTPHPATWFNQERFNDDPATWKAQAPVKPSGNGKPMTIFELKTVIEAKQKRAQDLKNKFAAEGPLTTDWSNPEAKESHRVLRQEIKELETQLANRV